MAFCSKCGVKLDDNAKFCANCGAAVAGEQRQTTADNKDFSAKVAALNNTPDISSEMDLQDINDNKFLAVVSYISILVLIPIFAAPNSKYARFHANQGLVLFILEIALSVVKLILKSILCIISWRLALLVNVLLVVDIAFFVLAILGVINAASGKARELPIIGGIKILK